MRTSVVSRLSTADETCSIKALVSSTRSLENCELESSGNTDIADVSQILGFRMRAATSSTVGS